MLGAVETGCFVMASVGAFYLIANRHVAYGRTFVGTGVVGALAASLFLLATGDGQGRNVAVYQPVTLAATEGLFDTASPAGVVILGQPDTETRRIDNPLLVPKVLSFIT